MNDTQQIPPRKTSQVREKDSWIARGSLIPCESGLTSAGVPRWHDWPGSLPHPFRTRWACRAVSSLYLLKRCCRPCRASVFTILTIQVLQELVASSCGAAFCCDENFMNVEAALTTESANTAERRSCFLLASRTDPRWPASPAFGPPLRSPVG